MSQSPQTGKRIASKGDFKEEPMKRVATLIGAWATAITAFIWAVITSSDFWNSMYNLLFRATTPLYPVLILGKFVVSLGVMFVLLAVGANLAKQAGVNID